MKVKIRLLITIGTPVLYAVNLIGLNMIKLIATILTTFSEVTILAETDFNNT